MPEQRPQFALVVGLSFIAGAGAGVAGTLVMRGRSPDAPAVITAAGVQAAPAPNAQVASPAAGGAGEPAAAAASNGTGVYINERLVSQTELDMLKRAYGKGPPAAHYWYDPRSGLYGIWGYEAGGYIRAGHEFGQLPANASNGNTGVFINGRQLNMNEAMYLKNTFGAVYQGRWWLDGTGNFGQEGNEQPLGNLVAMLQAAQRSGGGGEYRWRDEINRSSGGAVNGCVWVNSPGSTYSSSGCG